MNLSKVNSEFSGNIFGILQTWFTLFTCLLQAGMLLFAWFPRWSVGTRKRDR